MELTPDRIDRLLERHPVASLATLRSDGTPHQVPVVFAREAGELWIPIDGKPKARGELARVRNVRANPAASLLLDGYDADWSRLWWLRVDALARVVQIEVDDPTAAVDALRRKYPQYGEVPVLREDATLLALRPRRIASWCAGPSAADEA